MPLYEYQCAKCGRFELIRKFSDEPVITCPTCGSEVQKLASAPAFHLKGTGWYATDYAKKPSSGEGKSGGESSGSGKSGESKSGDGKSSESKSSGKSDSGSGSGSGDSGKSSGGDSSKSSKDTSSASPAKSKKD